MDLCQSMLKEDPNDRICMADIIGHPWLNNHPIADDKEVRANFRAREKEIKKQRNDNLAERIA